MARVTPGSGSSSGASSSASSGHSSSTHRSRVKSIVKDEASLKKPAKTPAAPASARSNLHSLSTLSHDDELGWRLLGVLQSIDFQGNGYVELDEFCSVIRMLTNEGGSSEWSESGDDNGGDGGDGGDGVVGVVNAPADHVEALLAIAEEVAREASGDGEGGRIVDYETLKSAILESSDTGSIGDVLHELETTLSASLEYTYEWGYIFVVVFILLSGVVNGILLSASIQDNISGPRTVKGGSFVGPGMLAIPYLAFFTPRGRSMYHSLFPGWRDWTLLGYLSTGWLYMANFVTMYWSDGRTWCSNDSAIAAANTYSFGLWAIGMIIIASPSGVRFQGAGKAARWREQRLLTRISVELPAIRSVPTLRTAGDVVQLIHQRQRTQNKEKGKWMDRLVFGAVLLVLLSALVTLPIWLRFFAHEDNPNILPGDWLIYGLIAVGNAISGYALLDNILIVTRATYKRVSQDIKLLSCMINSEKAASKRLPHMPPYVGNNDFAVLRIRNYLTFYDEALPLARATFSLSVMLSAVFILAVTGISVYFLEEYDQFAAFTFYSLCCLTLSIPICVSALLVNEALDSNTAALEEEMFYQSSRGNPVLALATEAVDGVKSLVTFLGKRTNVLTVAGIPITRSSITVLRVGSGAIAVAVYSLVRDVLQKVAEDDRGRELYADSK